MIESTRIITVVIHLVNDVLQLGVRKVDQVVRVCLGNNKHIFTLAIVLGYYQSVNLSTNQYP